MKDDATDTPVPNWVKEPGSDFLMPNDILERIKEETEETAEGEEERQTSTGSSS